MKRIYVALGGISIIGLANNAAKIKRFISRRSLNCLATFPTPIRRRHSYKDDPYSPVFNVVPSQSVLLVRPVSPKSQIDSLPRKNMANQANRSASLRRKCSVAGIKFRRPTVPVYSEEGI